MLDGRNDLGHSVPFLWRDHTDPDKTTEALYRVRTRQRVWEAFPMVGIEPIHDIAQQLETAALDGNELYDRIWGQGDVTTT